MIDLFLDKKKFESLILLGSIEQKNSKFEIKYLDQNKGEITFYFNLNSFDLEGWKITNLIGDQTSFELNNIFYAGAWNGHGFHEDGVKSALNISKRLKVDLNWLDKNEKSN